jgi:hypothetical protein
VNPRRQPPSSTFSPPTSTDPPLPDHEFPKKLHKRSRRKNKKNKDMAVLPKSAYVPPHLRNRVAASTATNGDKAVASAIAVNGKKAVHSATNGSDSSNTKQGHTDKLHLSS